MSKESCQVKTIGGELTDDMRAELEKYRQENEKLKAMLLSGAGSRALSCRMSEKGAISVYGLGRFPVTLYREQWRKLIEFCPQITAFAEMHKDELDANERKHIAAKEAKKLGASPQLQIARP